MATPITFNNVAYSVPAYNDTGYAQGAGNLSAYLVAIATGTLQPSGGTFSLTADVNFGTNFGLAAKYYKSLASAIAQTGIFRLGNAESVVWRNQANSSDLALTVNSSNQLTFNGSAITVGGVTSITGTANQIIASAPTGAVTLSTPQNIATTSTPTWAGEEITVTGTNTAQTTWQNAGGSFTAGIKRETGVDYFMLQLGTSLTNTSDALISKTTSSPLNIRSGPVSSPDNGIGLIGGTAGVTVGSSLRPLAIGSTPIGSSVGPFGEIYTKASVIFQESGAGTDAITFTCPSSIASSFSVTLPSAQGTNGQTWVNNGSGVMSFATLPVAGGGSGNTTFTAYSVICAGTTATGALQNVSGLGASGQVLTSNGAGTLPTWQNVAGSGTVGSGTAGNLALYPTTTNTVGDFYTQNGQGITIGIVAQPARTQPLTYNLPNPGNAVTATTIIVSDSAQTLNGIKTFTAAPLIAPGIAGDAYIGMTIAGGGASWVAGADDSAADAFVISNSTTPGTDDALSISTAEVVTLPVQGIIHGTSTNDSAAAGFVGEYVSSVISSNANFPTSNQFGDGTSISLTAGDWDVTATIMSTANSATVTSWDLGISITTGNSATGLVFGDNAFQQAVPTSVFNTTMSVPAHRRSLSGTTTIYLKVRAVYTVATPQYVCRLSARRVR